MKRLVLFLLISCCSFSFSNAQDQAQRLITEIRASNTIECYHLGYAGRPSELAMKADTLNSLLTVNEKMQLFSDSSYVLKYYCFHSLLSVRNDSIAFELLKRVINDTSGVFYFCGCMITTHKFNCLLVEEYSEFIKAKYTYGLPTKMGNSNEVHMFGKPDKKKYKEKREQLLLLINQSVYKEELMKYIE